MRDLIVGLLIAFFAVTGNVLFKPCALQQFRTFKINFKNIKQYTLTDTVLGAPTYSCCFLIVSEMKI